MKGCGGPCLHSCSWAWLFTLPGTGWGTHGCLTLSPWPVLSPLLTSRPPSAQLHPEPALHGQRAGAADAALPCVFLGGCPLWAPAHGPIRRRNVHDCPQGGWWAGVIWSGWMPTVGTCTWTATPSPPATHTQHVPQNKLIEVVPRLDRQVGLQQCLSALCLTPAQLTP